MSHALPTTTFSTQSSASRDPLTKLSSNRVSESYASPTQSTKNSSLKLERRNIFSKPTISSLKKSKSKSFFYGPESDLNLSTLSIAPNSSRKSVGSSSSYKINLKRNSTLLTTSPPLSQISQASCLNAQIGSANGCLNFSDCLNQTITNKSRTTIVLSSDDSRSAKCDKSRYTHNYI